MNRKAFTGVALATFGILGLIFAAGQPPETIPGATPAPISIQYVEITDPPATTTSTSTTSSTTSSTTTTIPTPIVFPDTPCQEWAPTAVQAGWPADPVILHTLLTIMFRESRCDPLATSPDDDRGLLQIHPKSWCKPNKYYAIGYLQENGVIADCEELYDPLQNLRSARALFLYSEARGDAWRPWAKTR
jgi:hypothetical protein